MSISLGRQFCQQLPLWFSRTSGVHALLPAEGSNGSFTHRKGLAYVTFKVVTMQYKVCIGVHLRHLDLSALKVNLSFTVCLRNHKHSTQLGPICVIQVLYLCG